MDAKMIKAHCRAETIEVGQCPQIANYRALPDSVWHFLASKRNSERKHIEKEGKHIGSYWKI
jgi:hypothetical protein